MEHNQTWPRACPCWRRRSSCRSRPGCGPRTRSPPRPRCASPRRRGAAPWRRPPAVPSLVQGSGEDDLTCPVLLRRSSLCWTLPGCRGEEGSTDLDTVTRVTTTITRSPGDPPLPAAHVDDLGPGAALQLRVDCRGPGALLGVDGVRVLLGLAVHRPRPRQPRPGRIISLSIQKLAEKA